MASSNRNSSASSQLQNSSTGKDVRLLMDQRKRKRMQSNRESARRSRMRKQKQLDDLMEQVTELKLDKNDLLTGIHATTQQFLDIEKDNSILRARVVELNQQLESLNRIVSNINTARTDHYCGGEGIFDAVDYFPAEGLMEPWMMNINQPIMTSADTFPY